MGRVVSHVVWKSERGSAVVVRAGTAAIPIAAWAGALGGGSAGALCGLLLGFLVHQGSIDVIGPLGAGTIGGACVGAIVGTVAAILSPLKIENA